MINSALVSYSLPAPYRRSLMLPPSRWRLLFKSCAFGHCYGVFLRAGFCVLFGSCTTARLEVCFKVQRARPPRSCPLSSRSGSPLLALGRSAKRTTHPHPTLYRVIVHCLGFAVRRAPFGVFHSAQLGAVARSLAPLPLLARAPLRVASGSPTRSARRLEKGPGILSADFVSVSALPLVAPLRVSLYWHFFCINDHSALFGGVALPLAQSVAPFLRSDPSECPAPPVK